jgi:peptidoglycan-associated lipoprotein
MTLVRGQTTHGAGLLAAIALGGALALAGCTNNPKPEDMAGNNAYAAPGTPRDFITRAGDLVYFSTDSTDLSVESQQTLMNQARWLKQYSEHPIMIEGHADERGTREYNIALGAKRAQTVRNFLIQQGISPARIRTASFGKERPVAVCNDISCWSQNRRAQTVVNGRHDARS